VVLISLHQDIVPVDGHVAESAGATPSLRLPSQPHSSVTVPLRVGG